MRITCSFIWVFCDFRALLEEWVGLYKFLCKFVIYPSPGSKAVNDSTPITDVTIVGAGLCGTVLAHRLARQYSQITLIDKKADCSPCFKAEKLEPDQVELLKELGVFDLIAPELQRIHKIAVVRKGRVRHVVPIEQYGVPYHDLVNCLRRQLPSNVRFVQGLVADMHSTGPSVHLELEDKTSLESKLAVIACGVGVRLQKKLGVERRPLRLNHSICFGFDIRPKGASSFGFDSITLHGDSPSLEIGYLTLFQMKKGMRVNFFSYWEAKDPRVRAFSENPVQSLNSFFPSLQRLIGDIELSSRVEVFPIDLYQASNPKLERIILASDFFQSVCPTTGMGLSKVLTDAKLLAEDYIPFWLDSGSCSSEEIQKFYQDPRKVKIDLRSFICATRLREMSINTSLPWKVRRTFTNLRSLWKGISNRIAEMSPLFSGAMVGSRLVKAAGIEGIDPSSQLGTSTRQ